MTDKPPRLFSAMRRRLTGFLDAFSGGLSDGAGSDARPPSSDGTAVLAGVGGMIIDAEHNTWRITPGRQVSLNGAPDRSTSDVLELAYVGGMVWHQNEAGLWWRRSASTAWMPYYGTRISPFLKSRPSQVQALRITTSTAASVTVHWNAPTSGAPPFFYSVQMRPFGSGRWSEVAHTTVTSALISALAPATTYEVEVLATNT